MLFDPQQYTIPASAATMAPSRQAAAAGLCADFQAFTTDEQRGLLLARLNKPEPRLIILPCDPAAVADIGGSGSTHVEFEFELQCGKESVLFFTTRFSAAKEQHRRWSNAGLLASRAAGEIAFPKCSLIDSMFRDFTAHGDNVRKRCRELHQYFAEVITAAQAQTHSELPQRVALATTFANWVLENRAADKPTLDDDEPHHGRDSSMKSPPERYKHSPDRWRRRRHYHHAPSPSGRPAARRPAPALDPGRSRDGEGLSPHKAEGCTQSESGGSEFWANLKAELSPQLPPERPTKSGTPRGSGGDAKNRQPAPAPAAGADDDGVAISSSADALARGLPGSCTKSLDGSEWRATHSQSPLFESGTSNAVDEQLGPPRGLGHTRAESIEKLLNYSPRFNLAETARAAGLSIGCKIGKGAYGTVWSATASKASELGRRGNSRVVVKHTAEAFATHCDALRTLREIQFLRILDHPNICKLLAVLPPEHPGQTDDVCMVLQRSKTDLHQMVRSSTVYSSLHVSWIMWQLLRAVAYLHDNGIRHRDIKPSNILIDDDCTIRLCDFGLARRWLENDEPDGGCDWSEYVCSRWYRAPECLMNHVPSKSGHKIDLWAVGSIMAEMFSRSPLFRGHSSADQMSRILKMTGQHIPEGWGMNVYNGDPVATPLDGYTEQLSALLRTFGAPEPAVALVQSLLHIHPKDRLDAAAAMKSEYFTRLEQDYAAWMRPRNDPPLPFDKTAAINRVITKKSHSMDALRELMFAELSEWAPGGAFCLADDAASGSDQVSPVSPPRHANGPPSEPSTPPFGPAPGPPRTI